MRKKRAIGFLLIALLIVGAFAGCMADDPGEVTSKESVESGTNEQAAPKSEVSDERKETLIITGLAWGAPANFNVLTGFPAWPCDKGGSGLVYEPMFMFNSKTQELEPLVATDYKWLNDYTVRININENAKFSDGEPLTSEDVKYTFELGQRYSVAWNGIWTHLDKIETEGDQTLVFTLKQDPLNRLALIENMVNVAIQPQHIWEPIEVANDYDESALANIFNEDPIGSGPYKVHKYDETRITIVRNDTYWGQELFGKLPAPKYITHLLFSGNDAASNALENGDLDYSENFHPNIWTMWEDGAPVKTYLKDSPYYVGDSIPSIWLNTHKKGLDNPDVRRALAYAINYPMISDMALSGYSRDMVPSVTIDATAEDNLVDKSGFSDLQWTFDLDKAIEILDGIGAVPGEDGIRVLPDGTRLGPWTVESPHGWSDWNASLEIVAQSAKKAGIEIISETPEYGVWENNRNTGQFDIAMYTPASYITPANPWKRGHDLMYSKDLAEIGEQAFWNYGRYHNDRANEIIDAIPAETHPEKLKELYTELNQIYLRDIPSIPLMYRPTYFYTVNESVWSGFPTEESDLPAYMFDGAGIRGLYEIDNN